jgi:GT2 family glycosyltransferase
VVLGAVAPDPDEAHLLHLAPYARTLRVDPPAPYAQCANIAYPRELLERIGGFDERTPPLEGGEDTDLAQRAIETGAAYTGAPDALTWHAVEPGSLAARVRSVPRWQHLAFVVARHPRMRAHLFARVFWRPSHAALPLALYGLARRRPLLALPWALLARPRYGSSPRGVARAAGELPGRLVVETTELATAVRGSVRYRTLFL